MKRLLTTVMVIALLAVASATAAERIYLPDNYSIGYTFHGYVKHADGWHFQSAVYSLVEYKEWVAGSYGKGHWQIYYDFKFVRALPKLDYKDPTWRTQYVELLRDQGEANAFERSMQALGLQYNANSYYQRADFYGPTLYRKEAVDLFNPIDLNVLNQQIFKNIEGMQLIQGQASAERKEMVQQVVQAQAIRELGAAYERLLKAGQPIATVKQEVVGPLPIRQLQIAPDLLKVSEQYKCAECHKEKQVKWTPQVHMTLDEQGRMDVIKRLVSKGKDHMPQGGPALSTDEVLKFLVP